MSYWLPGDILSDDAYYRHYEDGNDWTNEWGNDDWCDLDDEDICDDDEITMLVLTDWNRADDFDDAEQAPGAGERASE